MQDDDTGRERSGVEAVDGRTEAAAAVGGDRAGQARGMPAPSTADRGHDAGEPLLPTRETEEFRAAWRAVQSEFVDQPEQSVRAADTLVADVMRMLAESFAAHKENLENQWAKGEEADTEDLRVALQQYRSFFNRLLNT
ncbi:hypothetical protein [Yinghuangia seranimata]|uniref:hypothetical protein n=1 Tax=Yinghuangia seranimata TaxID=408067 RepID=UPI00248C61C4|nr:hypothetical protein [Yinghuangia seranimata]MDI2124683.1 hypothetical protein [Yinghuangia seranimata]